MGNTFGPNGFASGSSLHVSSSAKNWQRARELYRVVLGYDPQRPNIVGNMRFTYQEEAKEVQTKSGMSAMIAWVEGVEFFYPEEAAWAKEVANVVVGNAAIDALNNGRYKEGVEFASVHYGWQPGDKTRDNLLYGFQLFSQQALAEGDTKSVASMLQQLRRDHTDANLNLENSLTVVLNNAAVTALDAGKIDAAIESADLLHALNPTPDSEKLIGYIYGKQAQTIMASKGGAAGMELFATAIKRYPDLQILRQNASIIGNNVAQDLYAKNDFAGSVQMILDTIALVGREANLMNSLRVIYSNWAVGAANAGNLDEAERVATAGLEHFPGDNNLTQVINFVRRNR